LTRKQRNIERAKNIVIAALIVTALIFGWSSRLFGNGSLSLPAALSALLDKVTGSDGGNKRLNEAEQPVALVITNGKGGHYGVRYNTKELDSLYGRTSGLLGAALGTAEYPARTDAESWRAALKTAGVYFEYLTPVRLSVLSGWLGTGAGGEWGERSARRLYITGGADGSKLFFQDDGTGLFYEAGADGLEGLPALTDSYGDNGAQFAFERDGLPESASYTLLMPGPSAHPFVSVLNPLADDSAQAAALALLGVSEHLKSSYADQDGTRVYVEADETVSLMVDGTVLCRRSGEKTAANADTGEGRAIELAFETVSRTLGDYSGDASVCFDSAVPLEDGGWQVRFRYMIAGGRVFLGQDGFAALVTVSDGNVSEMELRYRNYRITDVPQIMIPEAQAAAAASGDFTLSYKDDWSHALMQPEWTAVQAASE
jgi:hypothetical protein